MPGRAPVCHILLWSYKDETPVEERDRLMSELEELPKKVRALLGVEWGPVVGGRNHEFSHCFVMRFDSMEGVKEYGTHPDHVHFSTAFREACAQQVVVDLDAVRSVVSGSEEGRAN